MLAALTGFGTRFAVVDKDLSLVHTAIRPEWYAPFRRCQDDIELHLEPASQELLHRQQTRRSGDEEGSPDMQTVGGVHFNDSMLDGNQGNLTIVGGNQYNHALHIHLKPMEDEVPRYSSC
ncbi:hypothetical protein CC2G_009890 [Coprinopsis cinerea AmutBmut pab1-1]|nr:hypothetical protein CC2G_009890 [Coprinopsis cinerea AmutBmut pab1-1]